MDRKQEGEEEDGMVLVPAAAIGALFYPWAIRRVLEVPPANDPGPPGK